MKLDWFRVSVMFLGAIVMAIYGVQLLAAGSGHGVTLLVFSGIGAFFSITDFFGLKKGGVTGKERIAKHLSLMMGATVATLTAFIVVNFRFEPAFVLWLAPTAVISPIAAVWSHKVKQGKVFKGMNSTSAS